MIKIPGLIILLLLAVFIESFFSYLSGLSFAIILSLVLFKRINIGLFLALFIPLSISMDIVNHTMSGGSLLTLMLITAIYAALQKYLPVDANPFIKLGMTLLLFVLFHIFYFAIFHMSGDRLQLGLINIELLVSSIKLSIIELIIFLTIEYFVDFFITGRETTLKLK